MYDEYIEQIRTVTFNTILPAGLGGLCVFALGLKTGLYRNNNRKRKLTSELLTTSMVALLLAPHIPSEYANYAGVIAFCMGSLCTVIIQSIRIYITRLAETYLDELLERRK